MKIYQNIDQLVGKTPLLKLNKIMATENLTATLLVKLEYFNPAGSVKDRVARFMIDDAEKKGIIKKGATIIEPTSGNTGIGLSAIGTARGYKVILTMPETMSVERRKLLSAYGAQIVLTDGKFSMMGAIEKAKEIQNKLKNSVILSQFDNLANPLAHYYTTGPEIWDDTDGEIDVFVAGVGTGGTFSGTAKYLKERKPSIKAFAVEPKDSPLLSKGISGAHKLQGIGANFIPKNFDKNVCDEVFTVSDADAYNAVKTLVEIEGVLVGISSGACLSVAISLAKMQENAGKTIVAILPDSGERYLSTDLFD